ncbi:MAG: hypothetical protein JWN04_5875, partial [Myxococcaceae bacterium]|nr:hypothetical protein [Myxococcaceae bacterium]
TVIAVCALRRVDQVIDTHRSRLIARWLARVAQRRDPRTGLIPHQADATTGVPVVGARGSSQALLQRFWPIVDPSGSARDYQRFRELFVDSALGFAGVREYPKGSNGPADVDSGPLLFGLSPSASAVAIGAARAGGDAMLATALMQEADVLGWPWRAHGKRRYFAGLLPIADAFLTWARTTPERRGSDQPVAAAWSLYVLLLWLAMLGASLLMRHRGVRAIVG